MTHQVLPAYELVPPQVRETIDDHVHVHLKNLVIVAKIGDQFPIDCVYVPPCDVSNLTTQSFWIYCHTSLDEEKLVNSVNKPKS